MSKRLFVGNLSFDVSEAQLQEAFAAHGSTGATIPLHDNGKPKGFGFVDVADDQVEAAISALDGKDLGGRNVAVSEARPRADAMAQGNRGGRGGGGGGRGGYGGGRDRDRDRDRGGRGGGGGRY